VAKSARSDKADRRAIVEQMRREQQRKERRQGLLLIGAAVVAGALIIGVAVWQFMKAENSASGSQLAGIGVARADAGCQDVVTEAAEGGNDHRAQGEVILYKQSPPAFGPHWGQYLTGAQIRKLYTAEDRPAVETLVHSLEHGHTILWYDETIAEDDAAMDELEAIAEKFPSNTDFNDKFIAAPWTSEDGEPFPDDTHVALTHWSMGGTNGNPEGQRGVWQYCTDVSGEAVEEFMKDYPYSDSPEPNAA
jgi:hypothetical protein